MKQVSQQPNSKTKSASGSKTAPSFLSLQPSYLWLFAASSRSFSRVIQRWATLNLTSTTCVNASRNKRWWCRLWLRWSRRKKTIRPDQPSLKNEAVKLTMKAWLSLKRTRKLRCNSTTTRCTAITGEEALTPEPIADDAQTLLRNVGIIFYQNASEF